MSTIDVESFKTRLLEERERTQKAIGKMTAAEAAVLGLLQRRLAKPTARTA